MVRWDRIGNLESVGVEDHLIIITNYTTTNEYLIDPIANECVVYGADAWYDWCFGEVAGQNFVQNYTIDSVQYSEWNNEFNGFTWVSLASNCLPHLTSHMNDQVVFYNPIIGISNPAVFTPPSICNSAAKMSG